MLCKIVEAIQSECSAASSFDRDESKRPPKRAGASAELLRAVVPVTA